MSINTILTSWLNLHFRSMTHHFWEGKSREIYLNLTSHGKTKKDRRSVDIPLPKETIIFMLKQIEPQFGERMKPKLEAFIRQLEREK